MSGTSSAIRGERFKEKRPPWIMHYRDLFEHPAWKRLSASAKIFYQCLKAKYKGYNNGKIKFRYRDGQGVKGISSRRMFSKARKELIKDEWIECRCQGGKRKRTNLYTLIGKYDKAAINPPKVEEGNGRSIDELLEDMSRIEEDKPSIDLFDDRYFDDLFENTSV